MMPLRYCFGRLLDLLVGFGELVLLFSRDDHVDDADGDAGAGGLAEAERLEVVERAPFLLAGHLEAAPDDVGELLLADRLVDEAEPLGPDFVEADAPGVVSMIFFVLVAEDGVLAEVGVAQADELVVQFDGRLRSAMANSTSVVSAKIGSAPPFSRSLGGRSGARG
jgi:hypothetical protein